MGLIIDHLVSAQGLDERRFMSTSWYGGVF
jgi:hypothetical protein